VGLNQDNGYVTFRLRVSLLNVAGPKASKLAYARSGVDAEHDQPREEGDLVSCPLLPLRRQEALPVSRIEHLGDFCVGPWHSRLLDVRTSH